MPETSLGAPSIDRHWLWAARTATVLSMLAVCMQVVEVMRRLFYEFGPFFLLVGLPVLIPYVLILERLRARSAKKGLALAVGWGSLIMCVSGLLLLASVTLYGTLLALTNAALVAAVIQTYYKMRPEPGDRPTLARGFGTAVFFLIFTFFLFYMVLTNQPSRIAANEASATSSLRALVTAQNKYANTNPEKGFATALGELGPLPGAALTDESLAKGRKSCYLFKMVPGPPDASGPIVTYTISAQPRRYGTTGHRSFSPMSRA